MAAWNGDKHLSLGGMSLRVEPYMKSLSVTEAKTQFSQVLKDVMNGETVEIVHDEKLTPIARIEPLTDRPKTKKRKLGILDGELECIFPDDFQMTEEESLNLK